MLGFVNDTRIGGKWCANKTSTDGCAYARAQWHKRKHREPDKQAGMELNKKNTMGANFSNVCLIHSLILAIAWRPQSSCAVARHRIRNTRRALEHHC